MEKFNNGGGEKGLYCVTRGWGRVAHRWNLPQRKEEIFAEKDWLIFNQSYQSPTLKVYNFTIFPSMSKAVTREQALIYGSRFLHGEQLNNAVMTVWDEKTNLPAISCGFVGYHQVVLVMLEHGGNRGKFWDKETFY